MITDHATFPNPTIREALCEIHFVMPGGITWDSTIYGKFFNNPEGITCIGLRYINFIPKANKDDAPGNWLAPNDHVADAVLASQPGFLSRAEVRVTAAHRVIVTVGEAIDGEQAHLTGGMVDLGFAGLLARLGDDQWVSVSRAGSYRELLLDMLGQARASASAFYLLPQSVKPPVAGPVSLPRGSAGALLELVEKWLAEDNGYDAENWPIIQQDIEENRLSDRRRFND